jgi:hypothetical protein
MNLSVVILLALFCCNSCATSNHQHNQKKHSIRIYGTVHKPYCGGAQPTREQVGGYTNPLKNESYTVYEGTKYSTDLKPVNEFTFDENGKTLLKLSPGNYLLMHSDKKLTSDAFQKKNSDLPGKLYKIKDNSCFTTWQNAPDFQFEVKHDTLILLQKQSKCHVGTNPCIEYIGPQVQ